MLGPWDPISVPGRQEESIARPQSLIWHAERPCATHLAHEAKRSSTANLDWMGVYTFFLFLSIKQFKHKVVFLHYVHLHAGVRHTWAPAQKAFCVNWELLAPKFPEI